MRRQGDQLRFLRLPDGRNALMDFYVYRERVILSFHFSTFSAPSDHCLDRMVCDGINLAKGCFEATAVGSQQGSEFSPYREKIGRKVLLCEAMKVQDRNNTQTTLRKQPAYEGCHATGLRNSN
jgi:hypothetical protein